MVEKATSTRPVRRIGSFGDHPAHPLNQFLAFEAETSASRQDRDDERYSDHPGDQPNGNLDPRRPS
jgi:hypothetical protein